MKRQRILILYMANKATGYGHRYRCWALRDAARAENHSCRIISDDHDRRAITVYNFPHKRALWAVENALLDQGTTHLVVDLPFELPQLAELCQLYNVRSINLNAHSYPGAASQMQFDLDWVQDRPDHILLRSEVLTQQWQPGNNWLVFGGSTDPLGLLSQFSRAVAEDAWLLANEFTPDATVVRPGQRLVYGQTCDIWPFIINCRSACLHMGMLAWELAYLRIPIYLVSSSELHLHYARKLASYGLARAFPRVGLPDDGELRAFLADPFEPNGPTIDGRGAQRLVAAIRRLK